MKNYYDKTWKIGELAKIFDVNVQLLRHYDKEGLLVPDIRNPENKDHLLWLAKRWKEAEEVEKSVRQNQNNGVIM